MTVAGWRAKVQHVKLLVVNFRRHLGLLVVLLVVTEVVGILTEVSPLLSGPAVRLFSPMRPYAYSLWFLAPAFYGVSWIYFLRQDPQKAKDSLAPWSRTPLVRLLHVSIAVLVGLLGYVCVRVGFRAAVDRIVTTGSPLVVAISAYERMHGDPPDQLVDLVPSCIVAIPSAPLGDGTEFTYRVVSSPRAGVPQLRTWQVYVLFSWYGVEHCCIYWPSRDYPDNLAGEPVSRWGDWSCVRKPTQPYFRSRTVH